MRDHKRIHTIQSMVTAFWVMNPDLRYPQVLDLINSAVHKLVPDAGTDIFYVEDDIVEKAIKNMLDDEIKKL